MPTRAQPKLADSDLQQGDMRRRRVVFDRRRCDFVGFADRSSMEPA